MAERTAALARSEANIRAVLETSHLYKAMLAPDGSILYVNATALSGIEARFHQLAGIPFWESPWFAATPGMPEAIKAMTQRVAAGATEHVTMALNMPGGTRTFDFSMRPVLGDGGDVVALVPEALDISERVAAEQTLQQLHKMEALGNLTGGIAHDFNNLLMAVLGSLELLRRRMPADPALLRLVDNARAGAERGASLTARMLSFARKQELNKTPIDLQQLIEGMRALLLSSLGPTIQLDVNLPQHLARVKTDPNQLETALLNLSANARDAMAGEGRILISAEEQTLTTEQNGLRPADTFASPSATAARAWTRRRSSARSNRSSRPRVLAKARALGCPWCTGWPSNPAGAWYYAATLVLALPRRSGCPRWMRPSGT